MSRLFNASDPDNIVVGDIAAVDITGTSWTIAAWAKFNSLAAERKLLGKWSDADGAYQYLLSVGSDGHAVGATKVGIAFNVITGTATLTTGVWYLLVLRQNGTGAGSLTLRVAGVADGSAGPIGGPDNTSVPLIVGATGNASTVEGPHDGLLSRVAIWNSVALSDGQADALLTTSPDGIGVSPDFYIISAVNELVDYAGAASLTNNGSTYDADEPFGGGGVTAKRYRCSCGRVGLAMCCGKLRRI